MEGIYAIYYTGTHGSGFSVFVATQGIVSGADPVGGTIDGDYTTKDDGQVEFSVEISLPPGTVMVTGETVLSQKVVQKLQSTLPANFANGTPIGLVTSTGPVNVIFRRLRELPQYGGRSE